MALRACPILSFLGPIILVAMCLFIHCLPSCLIIKGEFRSLLSLFPVRVLIPTCQALCQVPERWEGDIEVTAAGISVSHSWESGSVKLFSKELRMWQKLSTPNDWKGSIHSGGAFSTWSP